MICPEPYTGPPPQRIRRSTDLEWAVEALLDGEPLVIGDQYSTGLALLAELRIALKSPAVIESFRDSRDDRSRYQALSSGLLAPIVGHRLALKKAPTIGWFAEMYPDTPDLLLPFTQIQGLNSSWQWFERGVKLPVLRRRLHPLHGTYFPTRHEHLHLFADWLRQYRGSKKLAVDVGTGCGVLALQLHAAGFNAVLATDTNENAVEGLVRDLARSPAINAIEPKNTSLIGTPDQPPNVIVFNPPWLPGTPHSLLDQAIYYPPGLFETFFAAARATLHPEGRVVLLFSNLLQTTGASQTHPIEQELAHGGRFTLVRKLERAVKKASKKTRRRKRTGTSEKVQLWELAPSG